MNRGRGTARGGRLPRGEGAASPTDEAGTSSSAPPEAPAASSDSSQAPARGGAVPRATRGPLTSRFKPKAIRRPLAEREAFARQEEEKARARAADERRTTGRSRFKSRMSRGDAMGSRGRGAAMTASGPFSGGFAGGSTRSGVISGFAGGSSSGGGGGGGGRSTKSEGKGIGRFDADGQSEVRINADRLHAHNPGEDADSENEAIMHALRAQGATQLPVSIYRREHKDEGVVVATTAELEAAENANGEEESLWVDDYKAPDLSTQPSEDEAGDSKAESKIRIKDEPDVDDAMDLDADSQPKLDKGKRPAVDAKPKETKLRDQWDIRRERDMEILANELGGVAITGDDGEVRFEIPKGSKKGRLYMFQFPPLLPPLKVDSDRPSTKVKKEQPADSGALGAAGQSSNDMAMADAGAEEHIQGEEEEEEEEEDEAVARCGYREQMLPGGLVGKLNIRKSGKAEFDWGGYPLEMDLGIKRTFLQTAVIVEENDEKAHPDRVGGEAYGMGKIMGNFKLGVPIHEAKERVVDEADLVVDDAKEAGAE